MYLFLDDYYLVNRAHQKNEGHSNCREIEK